jgi:hypothetical protein
MKHGAGCGGYPERIAYLLPMKYHARNGMVCHMKKIFNNMKLMGTMGAILGGALGASWAMKQFWSYRFESVGPESDSCATIPGITFDEMALLPGVTLDFWVSCGNSQVYDWIQIAPVTLAAALVGAFTVLLGVGILRKVYRT